MFQINVFMTKIFFIFVSLLTLAGCYNAATLVTRNASMGAEYSPSDSEWFYVDLDVDAYEKANAEAPFYDVSLTNAWGDSLTRESPSNCEIEHFASEEERAPPSQTIICIMDLMEAEVTIKDLHLVFNIPEGMCENYTLKLPWHYNYNILPGPFVGNCTIGSGDNTKKGYCNLSAGAGGHANCTEYCIEDKEEVCYSAPKAPKCCNGGDKGDEEDWVPDERCFGGPLMATSDSELGGLDNIDVTFQGLVSEGGLRKTISIRKLADLSKIWDTSAHFANYIQDLDVEPEDLGSVRRTDLPPFLQEDPDYEAKAPQLFFEFRCIDRADEVLHEILLLIREWNTEEEFMSFYHSNGEVEGDPDVEGEEGDECEYESRPDVDGGAEPCNDMFDFADFEADPDSDYPQVRYGEEEDSESSSEE